MLSVQLFVPALLPEPPDPPVHAAGDQTLRRWLSRADVASRPRSGFTEILCAANGLVTGGESPVAPLSLLGEGEVPGDWHWLRADPVHLRAERNDLILIDASQLNVRKPEAEAMIESLDRHFAAEGLRFLALTPSRWYVRLPGPASLKATPPEQAAGKSIDRLLPSGEDALLFHRRANEAQMLMHDHPVNLARAERGEAPINSVWFWGAGRLPHCPTAPAMHWWADDPFVIGLARCAGSRRDPLPANGSTWLHAAGTGTHALVLPRLPGPAEQRQLEIERAWLKPLATAVLRGEIGTATLATYRGGNEIRCRLTRLALLKLWRRTPRLPSHPSHA
jgi:hypothetical protein